MGKDSGASRALKTYRDKRNFDATPEPSAGGVANDAERSFVVQKHWATRLHYDFRLELDGTMKSWAVPKGPGYDTQDRRMAMPTEDHPIAYNRFEGTIPAGNIWRRQGGHLGQGQVAPARRSGPGLARRQAQVRIARPQAARPLDAGAHARRHRRAQAAVGADQGA